MRLPGYPVTRQGWDALVKRDGWGFIEIKSKGRGGIRREYKPPQAIQALIETRQGAAQPQRPDATPQQRAAAADVPAAPPPSQDWSLLETILRAAEQRLQEPMTADLADKIDRVVAAWSPIADGRPDLAARLARIKAAADLLRP